MANTYTQIYLHVVFAVSGRACVISPQHREDLQKYITGIVTRKGQKLIAIYSMPDHTHVLLGLKPNITPSDLIGDIKTGSTNHINVRKWIGCHFSWQEGYGAFSVSHSHLDRVVKYIRNQPTHHRRKSLQREYLEFLERHHVPYDERYIFKPIEWVRNVKHATPPELRLFYGNEAINVSLLTELYCGAGGQQMKNNRACRLARLRQIFDSIPSSNASARINYRH